MIWSTSRPWKPVSVNFVASTYAVKISVHTVGVIEFDMFAVRAWSQMKCCAAFHSSIWTWNFGGDAWLEWGLAHNNVIMNPSQVSKRDAESKWNRSLRIGVCTNLHKRGVSYFCHSAGYFRFSTASGSNHEDVFGNNLCLHKQTEHKDQQIDESIDLLIICNCHLSHNHLSETDTAWCLSGFCTFKGPLILNLLHRFLRALATAFLASSCSGHQGPTLICLCCLSHNIYVFNTFREPLNKQSCRGVVLHERPKKKRQT